MVEQPSPVELFIPILVSDQLIDESVRASVGVAVCPDLPGPVGIVVQIDEVIGHQDDGEQTSRQAVGHQPTQSVGPLPVAAEAGVRREQLGHRVDVASLYRGGVANRQ